MTNSHPPQSVLDEIISLSSPRTPQPGDFTASDYVSRLKTTHNTSISISAARERLMKLVDTNILQTAMGVVNGKRTRLFWKAKEETKTPLTVTPTVHECRSCDPAPYFDVKKMNSSG